MQDTKKDEAFKLFEEAIIKLDLLSEAENVVFASTMSKLISVGFENNWDDYWYKAVVAEQILMPDAKKSKVNMDNYEHVMHILFAFWASEALGGSMEVQIKDWVKSYIEKYDPENLHKLTDYKKIN